MTITQTSDYVLSHPFTKQAVQSYLQGNNKDLKFLFDLLQMDIYQETAKDCAKAFKRNKSQNYPLIEEAIREVEPPERLNTRLPIPPPKPICIVVPMKVTKPKVKPLVQAIKNQLELAFPQKNRQVSKAAV